MTTKITFSGDNTPSSPDTVSSIKAGGDTTASGDSGFPKISSTDEIDRVIEGMNEVLSKDKHVPFEYPPRVISKK